MPQRLLIYKNHYKGSYAFGVTLYSLAVYSEYLMDPCVSYTLLVLLNLSVTYIKSGESTLEVE